MKNTIKVLGIIALVAVIGFTMAGCANLLSLLLSSPSVGDTTPAQGPLDGAWNEAGNQRRFITISGNTGVFTAFGSNTLIQDGVSKGYYRIGGQYLRNLTKTDDLTWRGQEYGLTFSGSNATGAIWLDWKAGIHTPLLTAVKFITFNMKFKKRKLGMVPACIINFLSNEDTSRLAARFFIVP